MRLVLAAMTLSISHGQVFLNHFYATVDSATYAAIEANDFLRNTFAVFEKRTTIRRDRTYTGLYLYGDHTYFEFFEAGKEQSPTPVGIAFGVEQSGTLRKQAEGWQSSGIEPSLQTITRQLDGADIPWFVSLAPAPETPGVVRLWMMEYVPEFLERWHSEVPTAKGIARSDVLTRYRAFLRKDSKWMADVAQISVQVPFQEEQRLKKLAESMGCRIEGREAVTGDARIRWMPPNDSHTGVRQIVLRLRHNPAAMQRLQLGTSTLELSPEGLAVWSLAGLEGGAR